MSGMAILDLGVGGGSTTTISGIASRCVLGRLCRGDDCARQSKFPVLNPWWLTPRTCQPLRSALFDAVVMAFNGLNYVIHDESRFRSLREIHRVVKQDSILMFVKTAIPTSRDTCA